MIGVYDYTVILTYMGAASAVFGIYSAGEGQVKTALICLMLSGFFDMFDGTVARTKKNRTEDEKSFGMCIDSLCDLVAFGVLPAVIAYALGARGLLGVSAMTLYVLAGLIRLAYFDVQEKKLQEEAGRREYYLGLPITSACVTLPAILLAAVFAGIDCAAAAEVMLFASAAAFLIKFKLKKIYMPLLLLPAVLGAGLFVLLLVYGGRIG